MQEWTSSDGLITIIQGDCRDVVPTLDSESFDAIVTDPPYEITSLEWDKLVKEWPELVLRVLKPSESVWVFGTLRSLLQVNAYMEDAGYKFAQDVIWEKHNGSSFHADRFRRVHEQVMQFYPGTWADVYKNPVMVPGATKRTVRRKTRPTHMGEIEGQVYESEDGGPKLERSVIFARSCHGHAIHPTQKPVEILDPLIEYSCPPGGKILDVFSGSASTAEAAHRRGVACVCIEKSPVEFDKSVDRIKQYLGEVGLFAS